MINKEQIVFLAAVGVLALGILALVTGGPDGKGVPFVPGEASPNRGIEEPSVAALFPPALRTYARNPFAESDAWAPPRAGRLPDLPAPPLAYAVPRVTLGEVGRVDIPSVQTEPPEEIVEPEPGEGGEDGEDEPGADGDAGEEGAE